MAGTLFGEKAYALHSIEQQAAQHHIRDAVGRKVFHQGKETVAEIEEGLARVVFLKGRPAYMVHDGRSEITDPSAGIEDAPAEVDLLQVRKKVVVESPERAEGIPADKQASTRSPKNIGIAVVLPVVLLHYGKDTPPTIGIPQFVDKTARGTGILEHPFVLVVPQTGLCGGNARIALKGADSRVEPPGGNFYVRIDQHEEVFLKAFEGDVVSFGKAVVAVVADDPHLGIVLCEPLQRIVRGSIVRHVDPRLGVVVLHQRGQELLQKRPTVPVEHHHRYAQGFIFLLHRSFSADLPADVFFLPQDGGNTSNGGATRANPRAFPGSGLRAGQRSGR